MKYSKLFRVKPGSKVSLTKIDPDFTAQHKKKKQAAKQVEKLDGKLRELQYLIYSEGKRSLLICLQALDGAGKDGTINHVLGSMNPQGTRVHGFKSPTKEERQHDFLWRIQQQAPKPGEVVIFNRSHYEDVLVVRVHNLVPPAVWEKRYALINKFEKQLVDSGTHIVKFFLHISPEEQLERFKLRLDDPARHWKISDGDYAERKFWDDYTRAYEDALSKTSTPHAPWYVIPSNNKWFRNLAVAKIVAETMKSLGMKLPKSKVNIETIRKNYHEAEAEEVEKIGKKKWKKLIAREKKQAKRIRKAAGTQARKAPKAKVAARKPKEKRKNLIVKKTKPATRIGKAARTGTKVGKSPEAKVAPRKTEEKRKNLIVKKTKPATRIGKAARTGTKAGKSPGAKVTPRKTKAAAPAAPPSVAAAPPSVTAAPPSVTAAPPSVAAAPPAPVPVAAKGASSDAPQDKAAVNPLMHQHL